MASRIDVRVGFLHDTVGADPVADALRAPRFFVLARVVGHPDGTRRVAEQREVEVELLRERPVRLGGIEADPEDLNVLVRVLLDLVAEPATFLRSPRGVGFRVEPENDVLTREVRKSHGVAEVVFDLEWGSRLSSFDHFSSVPP